ncbi:DUF4265 domain-containing protein [Streptomyces sp. KLOTTS4A1]|uniref:DUF4265 domain-containing protein n=1 Tax=Streptomyces sp. KLOTTS4A1 TaxID=3390996 RepID=UPI0039F49197
MTAGGRVGHGPRRRHRAAGQHPVAGETVRASENCTIRLIVLKDGGSAAARQSVLEIFHNLGTTGDGIESFRIVALDVSPGAHRANQHRSPTEHRTEGRPTSTPDEPGNDEIPPDRSDRTGSREPPTS